MLLSKKTMKGKRKRALKGNTQRPLHLVSLSIYGDDIDARVIKRLNELRTIDIQNKHQFPFPH